MQLCRSRVRPYPLLCPLELLGVRVLGARPARRGAGGFLPRSCRGRASPPVRSVGLLAFLLKTDQLSARSRPLLRCSGRHRCSFGWGVESNERPPGSWPGSSLVGRAGRRLASAPGATPALRPGEGGNSWPKSSPPNAFPAALELPARLRCKPRAAAPGGGSGSGGRRTVGGAVGSAVGHAAARGSARSASRGPTGECGRRVPCRRPGPPASGRRRPSCESFGAERPTSSATSGTVRNSRWSCTAAALRRGRFLLGAPQRGGSGCSPMSITVELIDTGWEGRTEGAFTAHAPQCAPPRRPTRPPGTGSCRGGGPTGCRGPRCRGRSSRRCPTRTQPALRRAR